MRNLTAYGTRNAPSSTTVLFVAASGSFLAFLDSTIVNVAFPNIEASFPAAGVGTLSWVLNAYNIVFAAFLVAAGRITDLIGRRRAFTAGVSLFTLASAACAAAGSVDMLITCRLIQGFGAAMLVPASLALVLQAYDREHRSHGIGLYGAASALAAGLGPPIGGALVEVANWRLCFLVNVPLGVAAIFFARRHTVESRAPGRRRRPDLLGAVLIGVGLGAFTLGTVKGGDYGWTSGRTVAAYLLSAVALGGFLTSSRLHPSPLIDPKLLKIRSFTFACLATVVGGIGFYSYLLCHILWLNYVWHYSLLKAGLAVAPGALVAAVVAARMGGLAARIGYVRVIVPGALVWATSFVWYVELVPTHPAFLTWWLPGQVLSGVGVGCVLPILGSSSVSRVSEDAYATASAVVSSARQLGGALGIATLVVVVGTPDPLTIVSRLRHGWTISAVAFLVLAVVASFARDPIAAPTDAAPSVTADGAPEVLRALLPAQPVPTPAAVGPVRRGGAGRGPLRDLAIFAGLPVATLREIEAAVERVELAAGEVLVSQGERSTGMWVVQRGSLLVLRDGVVVSQLGAGAIVGESSLLTGAPRNATVRARRDTSLLCLSQQTFDGLLARHPRLLRSVAGVLAERMAAPGGSRTTTGSAAVIAVVSGDRGAPAQLVADALTAQLGRHRSVTNPGPISAAALEVAESAFDLVVLVVSGGDDPAWRNFCLRVSDRTVVVHADTTPPREREAVCPGADLVFIDRGPQGEAAAEWQRRTAPRSRTVVTSVFDAARLQEGMRPLADRIAGRSLGLVLGGGGARAFAHLGVLEVLEEEGIHVDRVAGTSVGAVIAAAWAVGVPAAAVDAMIYEGFVRMRPFGDYTIPLSGLSRGRRTTDLAERVFGDLLVEELPREFRSVSVDLLKRERFVHDSGRLVDAVAASLRLPALYPPYRMGNRLHIDGGVLDNLPVTTLTEPREGPVVAVSISFGGESGPSRERTTPPRMPPIADTVLRSLMMGSAAAAAQARAAADLVISPKADGVGLLEFHQIDAMRESGRRAVREALPRLRELLGTGTAPVDLTEPAPAPGVRV